ncbi:MAG TPA: hypothetical protein VFJ74_04040 [Gemmatimonadaceae bacterium]|nr:hypothetical protein [Gemmatimonadaceae bacterium]
MADPTATSPRDGAQRPPTGLSRFLTPQWVLPVLGVVLVVTVLLTPATDRTGDSRLTTRSTEPQGARALYEIATRLGWRTEQRDIGLSAAQARLATRAALRRAAAAGERPGDRLDSAATYAVLDPPTDLTAAEAGALLDAVRRGAGLLAVLRRGATLGDSLHVQPSMAGGPQAEEALAPATGDCPTVSRSEGLINWAGGRIHSYWLVPRAPLPADTVTFASVALSRTQIRERRRAAAKRVEDARKRAASDSALAESTRVRTPHPPTTPGDSATRLDSVLTAARRNADTTHGRVARVDTVVERVGTSTSDADDEDEEDFDAAEDSIALRGSARADSDAAPLDTVQREPAAIGFPLGRGRVVVVADPDWLRNDVLRVCRWNAGVTAVRMLEYLRAGRPAAGARLVFDEFHQGYGRHPSTLGAIGRALTSNGPGRALLQALAAALLLLATAGARALPPRSRARLERRSPLEHVGALSRAYAQVGATRLATRRLVRGVRRRHGATGAVAARLVRAGQTSEGDDEFLAAVADRYPAVAADVQLVREALRAPRAAAQFLDVGRALERIEDAVAGRLSPAPPPVSTTAPAPSR